jgi:BirA family transcriptional regulator, biotin operon repressor / biotin---[acetyl-CoA-carboxylase] ligase
VCGILTEMKAEQDAISFLVLGIGVNVNTPVRSLPAGATSVREEARHLGRDGRLSRIELVKRMLEELEADYFTLKEKGSGPIIEEWKDLSLMIGSRVKIVLPNRTFEGLAHDLDPDGALVVRRESGILEKVSSGDVIMLR